MIERLKMPLEKRAAILSEAAAIPEIAFSNLCDGSKAIGLWQDAPISVRVAPIVVASSVAEMDATIQLDAAANSRN